MMKAIHTHKPLRRSKPINLPPMDPSPGYLIQFNTRFSGGFAIQCDGFPAEFSIEDLD
ncbi:hypothetical protein ACW5WQ_05540 [Aeromonas rivuli]|jgi:hypothetical protein|uniref:hypothetical protein n=1 Tax=Aeromonas TaxID=642 RepID=UPI000A5167D0|nr:MULTISPECIES: hypothetical protein [Aeromonas]MCS3456733.1 hypothetical protein [Aeromonas sp. BIGb0405]MCS3461046.1 hypothetical protein [Aeromonas sp. BIGb0445]UBO73682.1 hypothetical protein KYK33_18035 [Aeromonas rivuli]